jgi:arabinan endo-1,5-alpha-L-arabinosidase
MLPILVWLAAILAQAAAQAPPSTAPTPASPFGQGESRESGPRSQIRIRDPFVLPDPATKTYYVYGSTNRGLSPSDTRKEVVVYKTRDLDDWGEPITAWAVPEGHWGRETVWAPEVHRYKGRYYLFVTLTSRDPLPTPEGRPPNVTRGTEILVADRPEGPFEPFGHGAQTPHDWMALDGTLYVEGGVPYMVFCHEWIQITDGSVDMVRLSPDLSAAVGAPAKLFNASEAPWVRCRGDLGELFQGKRYHAYITDGPWFHRTTTGKLVMLWSSYGPAKYATGQAISQSGTLAGPWVQEEEPLWRDDGGHAMLFQAFDGRLVMAIHQPNRRVERARFFEIDDSGDRLRLKGEITSFAAR